jgi:hypothetical protein
LRVTSRGLGDVYKRQANEIALDLGFDEFKGYKNKERRK